MSEHPEYTLAEFKAWCEGEGRNGPGAGKHYHGLDLIERFYKFKENQRELVTEHLVDQT